MKLYKALSFLTVLPILLTGCAQKVSKADAIAHAKKYYTETEGRKATCREVTVAKTVEGLPDSYSSEFKTTDNSREVEMYCVSAEYLEGYEENKCNFYLDGKGMEIKATYNDNDIKDYLLKEYELKIPDEAQFTGSAVLHGIFDDRGFSVQAEESLSFEVSFTYGGENYKGKVVYTKTTMCSYK